MGCCGNVVERLRWSRFVGSGMRGCAQELINGANRTCLYRLAGLLYVCQHHATGMPDGNGNFLIWPAQLTVQPMLAFEVPRLRESSETTIPIRKSLRTWPKAPSTVGDCIFCSEGPATAINFSPRRRAERQLSCADRQGAGVSAFAKPRRTIHAPHIWTLTTSGSPHRWRKRSDLCVGNSRR